MAESHDDVRKLESRICECGNEFEKNEKICCGDGIHPCQQRYCDNCIQNEPLCACCGKRYRCPNHLQNCFLLECEICCKGVCISCDVELFECIRCDLGTFVCKNCKPGSVQRFCISDGNFGQAFVCRICARHQKKLGLQIAAGLLAKNLPTDLIKLIIFEQHDNCTHSSFRPKVPRFIGDIKNQQISRTREKVEKEQQRAKMLQVDDEDDGSRIYSDEEECDPAIASDEESD